MAETVIREDDNIATVINVFDVEASKQQDLIDVLNEGTEKVFRQRPGFVSVNILASKDGTKVVNFAQWRTPADVQATLADAGAQEYAKKAAALGKPAPGIFSVVSVHTA